MTNGYGTDQWIPYGLEEQWIPGRNCEKRQSYGPLPWKNQTADCPKLKDASGLSFKEWTVDLRRWLRASWLTPDVRILKILEALPTHLKGIFQTIPDAILFGPDGMSMIMSQVQIHCGLGPEDERKDVMNASMETKRQAHETIDQPSKTSLAGRREPSNLHQSKYDKALAARAESSTISIPSPAVQRNNVGSRERHESRREGVCGH